MTVLLGGPHDGMEIDLRGCNMIEIPEHNPDPTGPPWRYHQYKPDGTYIGAYVRNWGPAAMDAT